MFFFIDPVEVRKINVDNLMNIEINNFQDCRIPKVRTKMLTQAAMKKMILVLCKSS